MSAYSSLGDSWASYSISTSSGSWAWTTSGFSADSAVADFGGVYSS